MTRSHAAYAKHARLFVALVTLLCTLSPGVGAPIEAANLKPAKWQATAARPTASLPHRKSNLEHPRPLAAGVPLQNARGIYLARTYAYVADGQDGLAIVNIEQPEQMRLAQLFNAGGKLNDAYDVKVGMIYAGLFAYVADGRNGLKVVELSSPQSVPGNLGFSPPPAPNLIGYYPTKGTAIQVSEGYHRDRGVDESGNQIAIFGRRGARPFNYEEMRRMYLIDGQLFTVTDEPNQTGAPSAQRRE